MAGTQSDQRTGIITVIGIGPGSPEYLTPIAGKKILEADILVGGERALKPFLGSGRDHYLIKGNLSDMVDFINAHRFNKAVAVLASGDPAFYGIMNYLKKHFKEDELDVVPGISSIQLACARLNISWEDAVFYSAHGRNLDGLADLAKRSGKMILLTDQASTPAVVAQVLLEAGIRDKKIHVCERLSCEDEKISSYPITSVPENVGIEGCVVVMTGE